MSHVHQLIRYTRKQLKRLDSNLRQSIANGDVEATHHLRVASRRLEEPLDLMTVLTKAKSGKYLQSTVQRLRRAFRNVRDLDVLLLGLSAPPADSTLDSGSLARLEGTLSAERESAFSKAVKKQHRLNLKKLSSRIDRLCKRFAKSKVGDDLDAQLTDLLARRRAELLEYDPHSAEGADLHEARIRLKRFRYAVELVGFINQNKEDDQIQNLIHMQELLGKWNDHLVAVSTITSIAGDRATLPLHTEWSGRVLRYAAGRTEKAEEFRQQILDHWPSFLAVTRLSPNGDTDHADTGEDAHAVVGQE